MDLTVLPFVWDDVAGVCYGGGEKEGGEGGGWGDGELNWHISIWLFFSLCTTFICPAMVAAQIAANQNPCKTLCLSV